MKQICMTSLIFKFSVPPPKKYIYIYSLCFGREIHAFVEYSQCIIQVVAYWTKRKRKKTSLEVKQHPLPVCLQVLQSKPGGEVLNTTVILRHTLTNQSKGPQDYDSGNDTSSPPSTKTGISQSNVIGNKKVLRLAPASPEKLKFRDGDNASDSGNSVTSYASLCKPLHVEGGLSTPIFNGNGKRWASYLWGISYCRWRKVLLEVKDQKCSLI